MISKSKLAGIVLLATAGAATPTFAQALETGSAANRAQLYGWSASPSQFALSDRWAGRDSGVHAYAMVPGSRFVAPRGPAAAGGGSYGYNHYNLRDN